MGAISLLPLAYVIDIIDLGLYLEKSLSQVFGTIKLHKKRTRDIYFLT